MSYSLTKRTAIVYGIRINKPHTWADITIEEWQGGGSFKCISDYGNYSHIWGSIGERSLREFLCSLDKHYFLKKVTEYKYLEFDCEATLAGIRKDILKYRREGEIDKELARECFDEAQPGTDLSDCDNSTLFWERLYQSSILNGAYDGEGTNVNTQERIKPQCQGFWDIVWPVACEIWREELKSATDATQKGA